MPALSLASSKRMTGAADGAFAALARCAPEAAGIVAAVCAAATLTAPSKSRKRSCILSAPWRFSRRCYCLCRARQINRRRRAQQYVRHAILRCALRSRVAAHADALLAPPYPEPSALLPQHRALFIQQRKPNRLVRRNLDEKRSVRLHRRRACNHRLAVGRHSLEPNRCGSFLQIPFAREARIERHHIGVVPWMQTR